MLGWFQCQKHSNINTKILKIICTVYFYSTKCVVDGRILRWPWIQTNFNYLSPLVSIQWWKSIFAHYSAQLNENEFFFELAFKKISTNLCKKIKPSSYYGFGNRTASLIFSAQLELNKLISGNILENMLINLHNKSQPSKSISFNYNSERAISLINQLSLIKNKLISGWRSPGNLLDFCSYLLDFFSLKISWKSPGFSFLYFTLKCSIDFWIRRISLTHNVLIFSSLLLK